MFYFFILVFYKGVLVYFYVETLFQDKTMSFNICLKNKIVNIKVVKSKSIDEKFE